MKLLLLVNSSASSVTARGRVVIQKALAADHEVTLAETNRRGHATRLAKGAAADGVDVVVALGGDGTLNEAANGLAGSRTALAALPGGSTNVFARTIGLPNDPIEATGHLLEALGAGSIHRVGLGVLNGRYFLFHVGFGYDAAVVEQVERRSSIKRWAGHPLFIYAALATWFRHFDRRHPGFAVEHADGTVIEDGFFAIAFNSNPYTFVGNRPFDVAPEATLERGLVTMVCRSMRFTSIMRLLQAGLRGGHRVAELRFVDYRTDGTHLTVVGHHPVPYQVDGDFLGRLERLEVRHEPEVLDVVLPCSPAPARQASPAPAPPTTGPDH